MKLSAALIFASTAMVLALAAVASDAVAAGDACKNVTFKVTNSHKEGRDIKVVKVKFTNPHNGGKEQTEGVKNTVCKPGATCTTDGDNLSDADKVDLKAIKIVFRYQERDGDWSDEFVTQPYAPAYPKCTKDKQYGPIVVYG